MILKNYKFDNLKFANSLTDVILLRNYICDMKYLSLADLNDLSGRYRAHLINSITG